MRKNSRQLKKWLIYSSLVFVMILPFQNCKLVQSNFDTHENNESSTIVDETNSTPNQPQTPANPNPGSATSKPYPKGIFVSEGGAKIISGSSEAANLVESAGTEPKKCITRNGVEECAKDGVLVSVPWDLFEGQATGVNIEQYDIMLNKLINYIELQLDNAEDPANDLQIALIISDGDSAPQYVKQKCDESLGLFNFTFSNPNLGSVASSMCLPWDPAYLAEKKKVVDAIGRNFDHRKGLAYVYFTGPCSTNGNEGHCRISKTDYAAAGKDANNRYTESRMNQAYIEIMSYYLNAFPTTPITMEAHAMFRSTTTSDMTAHVFEAVWQQYRSTKRLGISAWWCAERLSVDDVETYLVWDILQQAAAETFTVCQPVGKVTGEPYRFTALNKVNYFTGVTFNLNFGSYLEQPLGYSEADYNNYYNTTTKTVIDLNKKIASENNVFNDFMNWMTGKAHHAGQNENIHRFSVMEPWTADFNNSEFTESFIDNF